MSAHTQSFRPNRLLPLVTPEIDRAAVQVLRTLALMLSSVLRAPGRALAWTDRKFEQQARQRDEDYLAEAVNIDDLERRMRDIDRRRDFRF